MIPAPNDHDTVRDQIMAFQPDVLAGAIKLSGGDQNEGRQLADLTFVKAFETPRSGLDHGLDHRVWLFSIMRSVFHSVERQRAVRRERGFTVNRLALPGHA